MTTEDAIDETSGLGGIIWADSRVFTGQKAFGGDQRNLFLRYLYLAYNFHLLGKDRFKRVAP